MTSRELVLDTLNFCNTNGRIPRQLWTLLWAQEKYGGVIDKIRSDFPDDISGADVVLSDPPAKSGHPDIIGTYVDEWGSTFHNIQRGVIGEVKNPQVPTGDDDWDMAEKIKFPEGLLTFDHDCVNRCCADSPRFMMGGCCPRPFERLQFIRGTENFYMDLMDPPPKMMEFIRRLHDFYCRKLTLWAKTDVDGLMMMDDWGAQNNLLISPAIWREMFMPMYKDYIDIAHSHGKKAFMHSDGNILEIIPYLIDLGLDAVNAQLFCMGIENLAKFKGKITFWGEIDRQHLLPCGTVEDIDRAVKLVYNTLWDNGGVIAQFEFGPGAKPENAYQIFDTFSKLR